MRTPSRKILSRCALSLLTLHGMGAGNVMAATEEKTPLQHLSLEEVIVSDRISDQQTTEIGSKEIEKGRSTTVPDILKNETDITINRKALAGDTGDTVQIRGLSGNRIMLNVDGRPVNAAGVQGGYFIDWSTIPLDNVEKIEIMKGGSSVKYGNNASGGVINVITKKPTETPITTLFGSLATAEDLDLMQNYRLTHSNKIGGVGFSIGASLQDSSEFLWNNDYQAKNLGTKLYVDTPGGGDLTLGMQYTDTTRGFAIVNRRSPNPDTAGWNKPFNKEYPVSLGDSFSPGNGNVTTVGPGATWEKLKYLLDVNFTQPIGEAKVIFKAYQNHEDRDEKNYSASWINPAYKDGKLVLDRTVMSDRSYGGSLETIMPLGASHQLDAGIDYKVIKTGGQDVHYADGTYGMKSAMTDSDGGSAYMWGLFLEDNWSVTDNLLLTLGLRFDTYESPEWTYFKPSKKTFKESSLEDEGVSPSLTATYSVSKDDTITASVYRKIITPSAPDSAWWYEGYLGDLYDSILDLETNQGLEFSYQHDFAKKTYVKFTSYYYDIENYIKRFSVTNGRGCYNIDSVKIAGAAIDGAMPAGDFVMLRANATYQTSEKEGDIFDTAKLTDELEYMPEWKINAGFDWRLPYNLTLSATARYVGEQHTIVSNKLRTLDSYVTVDTELKMALNKNAEVGVFVEDLFDEEYEERYGYTLPGRVIGMQMRYTF